MQKWLFVVSSIVDNILGSCDYNNLRGSLLILGVCVHIECLVCALGSSPIHVHCSTLKEVAGKEFTPAVVFKPLADEVKGLHSLNDYQSKEQKYAELDQLRQMRLTSEEIK